MTTEIKKIEKKEEKISSFFELNNRINIPVDGQIPLHFDKMAVKSFFLEYVNPNTVFFHSLREKIDYLLDKKYIDANMMSKYEFDDVFKLFKSIYAKKFRFESFMGAYKFYMQYAMRTDDGKRFLERFEDRVAFNALYLGNGDIELARNIAEEMISRRYQPATPVYLSAGRQRRGELVSCFLLSVEDNLPSILKNQSDVGNLSSKGGGIGVNLSSLREDRAPIKGIQNAASGVVPPMKVLEETLSYANQLG